MIQAREGFKCTKKWSFSWLANGRRIGKKLLACPSSSFMEELCGNDFVQKKSHGPQEFNQGPNARLNPNNMINLDE